MGYKKPVGDDNYLPSRFQAEFQELNYSPPEIVRSNEDILWAIQHAREVFARHGVKIRQGNSLDRLLANASSRLRGKKDFTPTARADNNYVAILAGLIIAFGDEPGIKSILEKITGSDVATSSRRQSPGKDMIWELTMLSNLRISAIVSKIAEPDLVADFGSGDYGVACKKIYSENSVEKALKKGVTQIERANLRGVVALNLDDLITPANKILYASSQDFFRHMMQDYISQFIDRHRSTLTKYAPTDICDGYIIYASAVGYVLDTKQFLPIAVNLIYDPNEDGSEHHRRLDALAKKLGNADGLSDWVKKVGGKMENW